MIDESKVTQLTEILTPTQRILVMVGQEATADQVTAAIALATGLTGMGKQVDLISPVPLQDKFGHVAGVEQFGTELGNKDLMVIFDYIPEAVDKVTYHIDEANQKFCLVIQPQKNHPPLDSTKVEYTLSGVETDLIFLVGVYSFDQLGALYEGQEQTFTSVTTVSLNSFESELGNIKLDVSGRPSFSEGVLDLMNRLGMVIDDISATNVLKSIEEATDHFTSLSTTAETFEMVAWLLRQGARRSAVTKNTSGISPFAAAMQQKKTPIVVEETKTSTNSKKKKTNKVGGLDYQPGQGAVTSK